MAQRGTVAEFSLADFQLLEELFRSANGAVFKAKHRRSGQVFVLKQRMCAELGARKDMLNEAKLLQRLRHRNVVQCFGFFFDESRTLLYMVLEYVGGGDLYREILRRRSRREHFSEQDAWKLFRDMAQGLQHLHENGVIHRDIKSLNILLTEDKQTAKIADLGVSRQVSEDTLMLQSFYGTPLYASPELCENKPYNEKTDIWSLGVVLYEMATLYPPFKSKNLVGLALKIKEGSYEPLPSMYSEQLCQLVAALLQTLPAKRPSISEIVEYISHVRIPDPPAHQPESKGGLGVTAHQETNHHHADDGSVDSSADTVGTEDEAKEEQQAPLPGDESKPERDDDGDDKSVDSLERNDDRAKPVERNDERLPAAVAAATSPPPARLIHPRTAALIDRHRRTLNKLMQTSRLLDGKDRAVESKIREIEALIAALESGVGPISEPATCNQHQRHQQQSRHQQVPRPQPAMQRHSDRSHAHASPPPTEPSHHHHKPLDAQSKAYFAAQAGLRAAPQVQSRPQTSDDRRAAVFQERRPRSASTYNIISGQWH